MPRYMPETVEKTEGAVYRVALNPATRTAEVLAPGQDPSPGYFARRNRFSREAAERLVQAAERMAALPA